ncbi:hypothetical protein ACFL6R_04385 [Gemmatimonadota bacterium]
MFYDFKFATHLVLLIFTLVFAFNGVVFIKTQRVTLSRARKKYLEGPKAVFLGITLLLASLACFSGFMVLIGVFG